MPEPDHFLANLQRGSLLLDQNRPKDALPFLQAAIAANPDDARGYAEIARCFNDIPAQRGKSIAAIDRAITLEPNKSWYYGRKGWFLVCLMRNHAAKKAADRGLALNPNCPTSLNALANAYTKLNQWRKAEETCRRILALYPFDAPGLNLLAQALRHQGKWKESREVVAQLLANMPNNAFGHANAGFAALAAGDHLRANEHFRESLRLDPHFDLARRGLLQSIRNRVWITRLNSSLAYKLHRPPTLGNMLLLCGGIGAVIATGYFGEAALNDISPGWGTTVLGCLLIAAVGYLILSGLVRIVGDFFLLFDPIGRHALTAGEKKRVSSPFFRLGFVLLALSFTLGWILVLFAAVGFVVAGVSILFPLFWDRWLRRRAQREASD